MPTYVSGTNAESYLRVTKVIVGNPFISQQSGNMCKFAYVSMTKYQWRKL